jgi:hypothetical protein
MSIFHCLADPGKEYLVYLPEGGDVTVDLAPAGGKMAVEWLDPRTGAATDGGSVLGGMRVSLRAPWGGDVVLYLKATSGE